MGVTRLIRKGRKNRAKSASRRFSLKHLTATPVIKNVDIEELKKQFGAAGGKQVKKEKPTAAAVETSVPEEVTPTATAETTPGVAEEVKEKAAKKPAAKKEAGETAEEAKAPKKAAKKSNEDTAE